MITDSRVWKIFTILLLFILIFPFVEQANGQINDPNYNYNQSVDSGISNWINLPTTAPFFSEWDDVWDDDYTEVNFTDATLDFHFIFYGLSVESLYISSNGYLTFDEDVAAENYNENLEVESKTLFSFGQKYCNMVMKYPGCFHYKSNRIIRFYKAPKFI